VDGLRECAHVSLKRHHLPAGAFALCRVSPYLCEGPEGKQDVMNQCVQILLSRWRMTEARLSSWQQRKGFGSEGLRQAWNQTLAAPRPQSRRTHYASLEQADAQPCTHLIQARACVSLRALISQRLPDHPVPLCVALIVSLPFSALQCSYSCVEGRGRKLHQGRDVRPPCDSLRRLVQYMRVWPLCHFAISLSEQSTTNLDLAPDSIVQIFTRASGPL
jgi:hypothetical protein